MSAAIALTKRNLGLSAKTQIKFTIENDKSDKNGPTPVFTSLDEIKGLATICSPTDLKFSEIFVTLDGSLRIYVEKIATTSPTNGKTEAYQSFLRLSQPIDYAATFPDERILKANRVYKFPFTFIVPDALLPQSCDHPKADTFPRDGHLNLPGSLGDNLVTIDGKTPIDDMCPDMVTIAYSLRCRISSGRGRSGKHSIIHEGSKRIRIIPALEEAPPMDVYGGDRDDYRLRKEKTIKRGLFRKKLGRITAEATQPKSLRLHAVHSGNDSPITTMTTINVRFDPADEKSQPPQLNQITAKLKVATFYTTVAMRELPSKSNEFHYSSVKGIFVENVPLFSRCLGNTQWERHSLESISASAQTTQTMNHKPGIPEPTCAYKGKSFYTNEIIVPIALPKGNKVFVPSFCSCLTARIYALDLVVGVTPPKATAKDPQLHLKLPIQVSCEGTPINAPQLSQLQAQAQAAQAGGAVLGSNAASSPIINGHSDDADASTMPSSSTPATPQTNHQASSNTTSAAASPATRHLTDQAGNRISFADEIPPAPGPGWTHLASVVPAPGSRRPSEQVAMLDARQRFQSLSFDDEDIAAMLDDDDEGTSPEAEQNAAATQVEAPPDYSQSDGRYREHISSSVVTSSHDTIGPNGRRRI